jgi:hypothetical protein
MMEDLTGVSRGAEDTGERTSILVQAPPPSVRVRERKVSRNKERKQNPRNSHPNVQDSQSTHSSASGTPHQSASRLPLHPPTPVQRGGMSSTFLDLWTLETIRSLTLPRTMQGSSQLENDARRLHEDAQRVCARRGESDVGRVPSILRNHPRSRCIWNDGGRLQMRE